MTSKCAVTSRPAAGLIVSNVTVVTRLSPGSTALGSVPDSGAAVNALFENEKPVTITGSLPVFVHRIGACETS